MDETVLEPTGGNASEAKREEPERNLELPRAILFWRRFFARVVDAVIVFFIIDLFLFYLHRPLFEHIIRFLIDSLGIRVRRSELPVSIFLFFVLMGTVFFEVALVYFSCNGWWLSRYGQSIGKRAARIRILDEGRGHSSSPLSFGRLFCREALFILSVTPLFILLYYRPLYGRDRFYHYLFAGFVAVGMGSILLGGRSISDRIAGTRVRAQEPSAEPVPMKSEHRYDGAYYSGLYKEYMEKLADDGTGDSGKDSA